MRKILIIITTGFVSYGGLTTVMMNYYRAMDKSGLQIDFASTNEPQKELLDEVNNNGSEYYCLGDRSNNLIQYCCKLKNLLRTQKYDIVHINGNSATMLLELSAAQKCGVPIRIAHGHNSRTSHPFINRILHPFFRKSYTHAVAVSSLAGDWLYGKENYKVLNNAIDLSKYKFNEEIRNRIRHDLGIENKLCISNVGKMNKQKNHIFLLNVFAEIKKQRTDACLLLVGGGILEKKLKKECKSLGIENDVIFIGMVDSAVDYFNAMDVFAFPTLWEGLGLALIEAQASGLPCLASDCVPLETKVSESVEYLSLEYPAEIWAEYILKHKINVLDTDDRLEQSEKNISAIRDNGFDIKQQAENLRYIYKNLRYS